MVKIEEKLQISYLTDWNLLVEQDLWQSHQILPIILQKEFIKLNLNMDTIIKNYKAGGIKYKDCKWCLEKQDLKIINNCGLTEITKKCLIDF